MKISKKYKPLFDLPKAKLKVQELSSKKTLTKKESELLSYYTELSGVDTIIETGGRFSAKSYTTGLAIADWVTNYEHRVLFTRYTLTSAKDSIIPEVEEKFEILQYQDYIKSTVDRIICKHNKGKILFKGHKTSSGNQTAVLKSLKDLSCFVLEEAEEHKSFADWEKVQLSIRATDVQNVSILILNPTTKEHWIYQEFFENRGVKEGFNGIQDNILYIHTDYRSTPREFIPDNHYNKFEKARKDYDLYFSLDKKQQEICDNKIKRSALWFKYIVLGGWRNAAEGVIFENWEIGEFNKDLPFNYGMDFGVSDPDAVVKSAIDKKRKRIYVKQELYKNGLATDVLVKLLNEFYVKDKLIIAESASGKTVLDLKAEGFNIKKISKNTIVSDIKNILGYTLIVDPSSIQLIKELNNYVWLDKKGDVPIDDYNHLLDAFRYSISEQIRPKKEKKPQNVDSLGLF